MLTVVLRIIYFWKFDFMLLWFVRCCVNFLQILNLLLPNFVAFLRLLVNLALHFLVNLSSRRLMCIELRHFILHISRMHWELIWHRKQPLPGLVHIICHHLVAPIGHNDHVLVKKVLSYLSLSLHLIKVLGIWNELLLPINSEVPSRYLRNQLGISILNPFWAPDGACFVWRSDDVGFRIGFLISVNIHGVLQLCVGLRVLPVNEWRLILVLFVN